MPLSDDQQTSSGESTEEKSNDEDHRKNYICGDYSLCDAGWKVYSVQEPQE